MHLFFEDGGDFSAATVLDSVQASGGSQQVELPSGKRLKKDDVLIDERRATTTAPTDPA